ncbi:MAG: alcohol dehydrogenase catalytic domain-containing protein, partial [Elusimicrobiota bacterium]
MSGVTATGRADPVLSGRNSMGTPDADLGLLYRLKEHYALGLSLSHLTQPNVAFDKKDSDRLPLGVSLGFNYRGLLSNTGLQYDTRRSPTGTRDQILTVAAERWLPGTRVVIGNSAPCAGCFYCDRGQNFLCDRLKLHNGAYADYNLVP